MATGTYPVWHWIRLHILWVCANNNALPRPARLGGTIRRPSVGYTQAQQQARQRQSTFRCAVLHFKNTSALRQKTEVRRCAMACYLAILLGLGFGGAAGPAGATAQRREQHRLGPSRLRVYQRCGQLPPAAARHM